MCRELASFIRYTLSVSLFSGLDDRLAAYANHLDFLPTAVTPAEFVPPAAIEPRVCRAPLSAPATRATWLASRRDSALPRGACRNG